MSGSWAVKTIKSGLSFLFSIFRSFSWSLNRWFSVFWWWRLHCFLRFVKSRWYVCVFGFSLIWVGTLFWFVLIESQRWSSLIRLIKSICYIWIGWLWYRSFSRLWIILRSFPIIFSSFIRIRSNVFINVSV